MSDYDRWKTTDPSQEGPTCDLCGGWLVHSTGGDLFCEPCESDREQLEKAVSEQPQVCKACNGAGMTRWLGRDNGEEVAGCESCTPTGARKQHG
jgi:hypothetical protein